MSALEAEKAVSSTLKNGSSLIGATKWAADEHERPGDDEARSTVTPFCGMASGAWGAGADRPCHITNAQDDAGVLVSMLRPRLRWSSISAAAPIIRPYRNTVKAAVSRSRSLSDPALKSLHSSASSSAAITASTLTQKT